MGHETALRIACHEAIPVAVAAGPDLEDRLRAAMQKTYRHWMATDEDDQFKAAVAATLEAVDDGDRERIMRALRLLNTFGAAVAGVPVDFSEFAEDEDAPDPAPLIRLWDEVKAAADAPAGGAR